MPHASTWGLALIVSTGLHLGAAGLYLLTRDLDPAPSQSTQGARLRLETVTAPRQQATPRTPDAQDLQAAMGEGQSLASGAVPQSDARPVTATGASLPALAADAEAVQPVRGGQRLAPASIDDTSVAPIQTDSTALAPARPDGIALDARATDAQTVAAAQPRAARVTAAAADTDTVAALDVDRNTLAPAPPDAVGLVTSDASAPTLASATPDTVRLQPFPSSAPVLAAATPPGDTIGGATPDVRTSDSLATQGTALAAAAPPGATAPSAPISGVAAAEPPLPAARAKAVTGWQFEDRIITDPTAVATIQAFMTPAETQAQAVRDDLTALLSGIDCARVSATFLPDTGALEMRGHIPDPALRDQIVAAMQTQVGAGLPVTANLLHLPAPQCGALTGIADVGLPQSTDQFTNDRLVGETAHARAYTYAEGQRLQFDLAAPDYDAFVYVDYFNADGDVIHLIPNETLALENLPAKSLFGVGTDRPGKPGLKITIGPPFGQEIAVAFAASEPLYQGLRPIVEPAQPYLEFLKDRVAAARRDTPGFKGEWVYFFITTRPATQ